MERLNLTLDADTAKALGQHAREHGRPRASVARELIREALELRAAAQRKRQLARDYLAGRKDAVELLRELEGSQLDIDDAETSVIRS